MASKGAGQSGSFALSLAAFAAQATEALDASLREIIIEVGSSLIRMSPVGNPEIWAQNAVATRYNKAVDDHNSALRSDPANLTKAGRLRPGRKVHDGMDIAAPAGYVGGRFRGNWMFSIGTPNNATTEEVDPTGTKSTARITAGAIEFKAGDTCYISDHNDIGIGLNAKSPNADAAKKFLTFVSSPEFADIYANSLPGFFSLNSTAVKMADPLAQEFVSWREKCKPTIRSTYQILSRGTPNLENETWVASANVINGTETPQAAAKRLQDGLDSWFKPAK